MYAYLWVSMLIDVTPGNRKSKSGREKPASAMNGMRKPPKQASTCNGMLYLIANCESSSIGSIAPFGKFGAEAPS